EVALRAGCRYATLVQRAADIPWEELKDIERIGVTAGASAPEVLVEEVLDAFAKRYTISVETITATEERMFFPLPRPLRETQAAE
ncbi:MAG TPA: 4-hydroxy-3-methylbut-2-enyl diphosphate reductase, partial [Pseudolabrys sp.]|nr:4-hydroxy-3-methylbut-2-enyl diphosphate reductase [Pseudolabrys sp.]